MSDLVPVQVSTFDAGISLKKFFYGYLITIIPVSLIYISQYLQTNTEIIPPSLIAILPLIIGLLEMIANIIKHLNDTETVMLEKEKIPTTLKKGKYKILE